MALADERLRQLEQHERYHQGLLEKHQELADERLRQLEQHERDHQGLLQKHQELLEAHDDMY